MTATTPAAVAFISIIRSLGAADYDTLSGAPGTTKLLRFRLPNGCPFAVQVNNKVPRAWMLADHDDGSLARLGKREHYEAGRGRHHHLRQVREFNGRALVKVAVTADWPVIKEALASIGGRA